MYTVRDASVKNVFHGLSSSIEGMSLAMYLSELAAALSPPAPRRKRTAAFAELSVHDQ